MSSKRKVVAGTFGVVAVVGLLVFGSVYMKSSVADISITNQGVNMSHAPEAKTVTQEKDGHITFK